MPSTANKKAKDTDVSGVQEELMGPRGPDQMHMFMFLKQSAAYHSRCNAPVPPGLGTLLPAWYVSNPPPRVVNVRNAAPNIL